MVATKPIHVRDLMSKEVATLERNDKLSVADNMMQLGRIRHMVVLDEERAIAGVVSQRDLLLLSLAVSRWAPILGARC